MHLGGLRVLMKRGADCTLSATMVQRFFKDQPGSGATELALEVEGWQALTIDSEDAVRIWHVQHLDIVAQFLDGKQLV